MTATLACPGCQSAPADADLPAASQTLTLYLPDIHCAACISTAERALSAAPGVRAARVNLTLRRAAIDAAPWVEPRDLVETLARSGIEALEFDAARADPADPAERAMLLRLGVAGFAMMNVMLLSVAVWSGATDATRDLFHWLAGLIAIPAALFSAQPFFRSALAALAVRRLNMDVPISFAILLALGLSLYETAQSGAHAYFDAALSLTFFLLVGRYLDLRVRGRARSAASELAALEVPRAIRIDGTTRTEVRAAALAPGDLILVPPGTRLPADGTVTDGQSEIDRSLLTGETAPVSVAPGTDLAAGEVNLSGPLTLRVTASGRNTRLARIADLVANAENARSRYVTLADRAARIYAPVVHLLALAAFAAWVWATGDVRHAMNVAVATLIITCPCALGLAIPAVSAAASARLYRMGALIKSGTALERLAEVDTALFDKTGTLTEGRLRLREHLPDADLALAAGLASGSVHPLAQAVADAARARGLTPPQLSNLREHPGDGIEGWLPGTGAAGVGRAGGNARPTRPDVPPLTASNPGSGPATEAPRETVAERDARAPAPATESLHAGIDDPSESPATIRAGDAGAAMTVVAASVRAAVVAHEMRAPEPLRATTDDPSARPETRRARHADPASTVPADGACAASAAARDTVVGREACVPEPRRAPAGARESGSGRRVRLGRPGWVGAPAPDRTATCLDTGDGPPVVLTFEDVPRAGAAEAVAGLRRLGLPVSLVSGDAPAAARALAADVGIVEVHAPERPEAKAARVRALAADGRHVLMVGDGLNDTAALAAAHASIAPASALDAARVVADIVLTGRSLAPVPTIVATARAARARMRENLGIAAAYNAVAIPLAVTGHATPIMAALAMSASSICVSLNALRVR